MYWGPKFRTYVAAKIKGQNTSLPRGIWIAGKSGFGKSRAAYQIAQIYACQQYKKAIEPIFKSADVKWFPPVSGSEKVVICNDISCNPSCGETVSLLEKVTDCYGDDSVEIKNGQIKIFWDFFIVTSNYMPEEIALSF